MYALPFFFFDGLFPKPYNFSGLSVVYGVERIFLKVYFRFSIVFLSIYAILEVIHMNRRMNYRKLLTQWMQFYSLPAGISKKMFNAIWIRLQALIGEPDKEGADHNETHMERSGRTGKAE